MLTHKHRHQTARVPINISGNLQHLGKTLCCPKMLMHNRPLSLTLSPSLSPFGLVKHSQSNPLSIRAWCFCLWLRGPSELVFQRDGISAAACFLLSTVVYCWWAACQKPCWFKRFMCLQTVRKERTTCEMQRRVSSDFQFQLSHTGTCYRLSLRFCSVSWIF